jgi:hypothetical protein
MCEKLAARIGHIQGYPSDFSDFLRKNPPDETRPTTADPARFAAGFRRTEARSGRAYFVHPPVTCQSEPKKPASTT